MRKYLPVALFAMLIGAGIGSLLSSRRTESLRVGTPLAIDYPTGNTVTGMHGAHPQAEYKTVHLRIARVNAENFGEPLGTPWRIRLEPDTYYAVAEED